MITVVVWEGMLLLSGGVAALSLLALAGMVFVDTARRLGWLP